MSLRAFHVLFISASVLLALMLARWATGRSVTRNWLDLKSISPSRPMLA